MFTRAVAKLVEELGRDDRLAGAGVDREAQGLFAASWSQHVTPDADQVAVRREPGDLHRSQNTEGSAFFGTSSPVQKQPTDWRLAAWSAFMVGDASLRAANVAMTSAPVNSKSVSLTHAISARATQRSG